MVNSDALLDDAETMPCGNEGIVPWLDFDGAAASTKAAARVTRRLGPEGTGGGGWAEFRGNDLANPRRTRLQSPLTRRFAACTSDMPTARNPFAS